MPVPECGGTGQHVRGEAVREAGERRRSTPLECSTDRPGDVGVPAPSLAGLRQDTGPGWLLRALAAALAVTAVAAVTAAAGAAMAGDAGARLARALPHYAMPALAAGWVAAALAMLHLRSLARTLTPAGAAIRTAAHLCAPPLLWLAAMHGGACSSGQVRRTPIAYGRTGSTPRCTTSTCASRRAGAFRERRGSGDGAAPHRSRGVAGVRLPLPHEKGRPRTGPPA